MTDTYAPRELKFRTLAKQLRQEIANGVWEPGARLPTEKEFSVRRGLSLTTVRRALEELSGEGLIIRRQGSGSYVSAELPKRATATRTVGVLVPTTAQYYGSVLAGVEDVLSQASARLVLASSRYSAAEEERDIASLLSSGVDGLLLVPDLLFCSDPREKIDRLFNLPVPVVMLERRDFETRVSDRSEYVRTEHEGGAYDAVAHLHALGHERIALVCRNPNPTGVWVQRGFEHAIADMSLPKLPIATAPMNQWSLEMATVVLGDLRKEGATAALVFGDREAAWFQAAARRANLSIPGDLAMVSYDDEGAEFAEIPLTAVSPPKRRLGRLAAEILLHRLKPGGLKPRHQISLRPPIVIRDSCGAMAATTQ